MAALQLERPGDRSAAARSRHPSPAAIAAWSQRDRSWSGSSTRSPPSEKRAAARACWKVSSAASPHASASPGGWWRPAGQPDRVAGEVAVLGAALGGDEALVVHQPDDRQHVGEPLREHVVGGDRQRDAGHDDLALGAHDPLGERASLTRNAREICGVVMPTTARRVSASRASGARAGWQQAKSSASRSSVAERPSYAATSGSR